MHHSMDQLDMLDPTGSMTTLAPISETPLTPSHQHLHGSYHSMNHMMSHHHPSSLSGHSAGMHIDLIVFQENLQKKLYPKYL